MVEVKEKSNRTEEIVLVAGLTMVAGGLYLGLRKGPAVRLGDKITVSKVGFSYLGPSNELFLCWGLKDGKGDFNNGDNLVNKYFTWGGPIEVAETVDLWKSYEFIPKKDFDTQPIYHLDPKAIQPKNYETYAWLSVQKATADENYILLLIRAGYIDVKSSS